MGNGILLSGEIRSVTERKEKDGGKIFAHAYQVEVADGKGRVSSYDVMDWGKEQHYKKGDLLNHVPVRASVGNYGNVEFTIIKNNGSGAASDVPVDAGKAKKPDVKI
jgi:hypothetical protein